MKLEVRLNPGVVLTGGGLSLVQEGGAVAISNRAAAGTPFALDESGGVHTIAGLSDVVYGDNNSWIGNGATDGLGRAFVGVGLGASPVSVGVIAFGRDTLGAFSDRTLGLYTLQYTAVPNPNTDLALADNADPTMGWATIGTIDYQSAGGANFAFPALRHVFNFNPVQATGVRLIVPATGAATGTAIDEIELYATSGVGRVTFAPAAYATPTNNSDTGLGVFHPYAQEPMISVNQTDPANLAVSDAEGLRVSTDAGATFGSTNIFQGFFGINFHGGDTDTAFNADGALFWTNLISSPTGNPNNFKVGINGVNPATGAPIFSNLVGLLAHGYNDKAFIAADNSPTSPYKNNLYVAWTAFDTTPDTIVFCRRPSSSGFNWDNEINLSASAEGRVWPPDVRTAANGDVYVAYHSQPDISTNNNLATDGKSGQTFVLRSTDGGITFPQKNLAFLGGQSDISFNRQTDPGTIPQTQFVTIGSGQPWVLPDPVRPNNVYVIAADDPDNIHGTIGDDADVVIARSTDNGLTWTRSTLPFNPPGGSHQLFPTAAIDQFGNIAVAWYDTRRGLLNADNRLKLDVFASYSGDGGLTWATPFMVNDLASSFDPDIDPVLYALGPPPTTRIGEYFGLDLFGNTAHLAWNGPNPVGPATQTGHQVVYDKFAMPGTITVNGDDLSAANETFVLSRMAGSSAIQVTVNGKRLYAGLPEGLSLVINGFAGNDTFTVDYVNGNPIPTGGLCINGGTGADKLIVHASGATTGSYLPDSSNGAAGKLTIGSDVINFEGLESSNPVELDGFAGSSTFTITTPNSSDDLTVDTSPDNRFRATGSSGGVNFVPVLCNAGRLVVDAATNDGASPADSVIVDIGGLLPSANRECVVNTGLGGDTINIRSLATASLLTINAGANDDAVTVDSNGVAAGGTVDLIFGTIAVNGQGGNDSLTLEDSSDATADVVTVDSSRVGVAGDTFFGVGGSLTYAQLSSITLNLSNDTVGDIVNVTPAPATTFFVNGNAPTTSSGVGDGLHLNLAGVNNPVHQPTTSVDGQWIFGNRQPIAYTSIEEQIVVAPARVSGIQINGSAIQRSQVTSLAVTFDQPVTFAGTTSAAFQLQRQTDGKSVTLSASQTGNTVTLTFTGGAVDFDSLADGRYTLTIDASKVSNSNGQLDGNGDGIGGDNYELVGTPANGLFRLFGDADGNGSVTAADFNAFRLVYGSVGPSIFDFNGDGQVSAADFNEFRTRYGITLMP